MTFLSAGGRSLVVAAVAQAAIAAPAGAADLSGNCCGDLDERVAELETSVARKGNRKVSLTISGHVNQTLLFWDDGQERNAYVVGNKNDQSQFTLAGDAEIGRDWKAGYELTLRLRDTLADEVTQASDDAPFAFVIWKSNVYLESKQFGKLTLGQASRASDTAPEQDLSATAVAAYAGVQDIGGAFLLRRSDSVLSQLSWGGVTNHFNGDTANIVRWDSPEFAGFTFAANWGEDDLWDVGLYYKGEARGFKVAAAGAYTRVKDTDGVFAAVEHSTALGSFSVLHEPSGLNVTVAGGVRRFDDAVLDTDGLVRTPDDARFFYVKGGWITKPLPAIGPTAFYGEYGRFTDFVSAGTDLGTVASLAATGVAACGAGIACRATGGSAEVWGFGVVQQIENAAMDIYLGYRRHSADFDLVDGAGNTAAAASIKDFDTVIVGSKVAF